jgi:hypothetical protein
MDLQCCGCIRKRRAGSGEDLLGLGNARESSGSPDYSLGLDSFESDFDKFASEFGGNSFGFPCSDEEDSDTPPVHSRESSVHRNQSPEVKAAEIETQVDTEAAAKATSFALKAAARRARSGAQGCTTPVGGAAGSQPRSCPSLCLAELEELGPLGSGGYSRVALVRPSSAANDTAAAAAGGGRPQGTTCYALKAMAKHTIVSKRQTVHVRSERDALRALEGNRFVCQLVQTFQDPGSIFLLLEFCQGGELFEQLLAHETLPEPTARFYCGCVLKALEAAHSHDFIYRDLKPGRFPEILFPR